MKRTSLLLAVGLLITWCSLSHAQVFHKTKGKTVQRLLHQTTHVYTAGPGAYTNRLTAAFNSYWKVTPFEFHDISKGLPKLSDEPTIFAPGIVMLSVRDNPTAMNYPFFVLAMGGSSGRPDGDGIIAAFPINGWHYELNATVDTNRFARSLLRLPYLVYTANEMATHIKNGGNESGYYKMVDGRNSRIAGKTLLIPADLLKDWDVNPNTTALMKADLEAGKKPMKPIMAAVMDNASIGYAGKYKVMSTEEIMQLEQGPDADKYAVFLPAIDDKKYVMVFDLKSRELLYFETVNMSMRIKDKDFNKLNKAVGL